MTTLDGHNVNTSAKPKTSVRSKSAANTEPAPAVAAPKHPKADSVRHKLRKLEQRAIHLPVVGKLHAPDTHDVVYVSGLAAMLMVGVVELPIALFVLGGHVLVKQHHHRSLSAIGEVFEDFLHV
jgi:hypothetical protein